VAKTKARLFAGPGSLDGKQLLKVWKLAKAHPTFIDPFPQTVGFRGVYKTGWLPSLKGARHVAATKHLRVKADLDVSRMSPRMMAGMLGGMRELVPVTGAAIANDFCIECHFRVPGREDNPGETKGGSLMLSVGENKLWFHCWPNSGFSHGRSPRKTFAAERRHNEEVLSRVITATELPLRLTPAGKSFAVEHTAGGELKNVFEPAENGTFGFVCTVPGSSPLDLANRLRQALDVLTPLSPPSYACGLIAQSLHQPVDPCQAIYEHLQEQAWPVRSSEFDTMFRVGSPEGLGRLRVFLPSPRKRFRLELGRFKPVAQAARSPVTKLIVQTRQDGHSLSLLLPPEHHALKKPLEGALGVVF